MCKTWKIKYILLPWDNANNLMIDLADLEDKIIDVEKRLKTAISDNFSANSINQIRDNLNYLKDRKHELLQISNRVESLNSKI